MNYVYDHDLEKWLVLIDDVVIRDFDTEDDALVYILEREESPEQALERFGFQ